MLSHLAAGVRWKLLRGSITIIDITVPARNPRPPAGVRIHRVRRLDPRDVARRDGLPVTAPARTLLDLAEVASLRTLERAFDEAVRIRLVSDSLLRDLLARSPGRRGAKVLRVLLERTDGPAFTRSEAEERLLALIRAARLPSPQLNVRVGPHEVDLLWQEAGLAVEVDGFAYHSTRTAFERDRLRDAELEAIGLRVVRVTWRQIAEEPHALVARLARALTRPRHGLSSGQWR
jgi:very-short-patch-repair endonuclease